MTKQTIQKGCAIVIAVYMVIACAFYFIAKEQLYYRNEETAMLAAEMPVGELTAGMELRQSFLAEADELNGLSLMISTYGRVNTAQLFLSVADEQGEVLSAKTVDSSTLTDNAAARIYFDAPITLERGKMYDIVLTSNGTAGDAVTVWYGTGVNTARATVDVTIEDWEYADVNGQVLPGKLCYAMYGRSYLWVGQIYWYMVAAGLLLLGGYSLYTLKKAERGEITLVLRLCYAFQKYNYLLRQLVSRDFKTKYKRSVLGVFWSFLNPLLTMAVQYIVFSTLFKSDIPNFALYLLIGIVCFSFFSEATSMSLSSIVGNASLINKVYVPKYIYPVSRVISSVINLLLSLIPLFLVMLITRTPLRPVILLMPFGLLCLMAVSLGIGLLLSTSMVFFRDTQFLWGVLSMIWMYATPVFYPETIIPGKFMLLYKCNPLYHILRFMRTIMINGVSPEPKAYVLCAIACFVPLVIGAIVFKKNQDKFVLYL